MIVLTVTDDNGNFSTCESDVYIEDVEAPTIFNCPADIEVDIDGVCDTTISWIEPTTADNCAVPSFVSTHLPGDVFEPVTTTVTYTATDPSGNTTACNFDVIVNDIQPISIVSCPADIDNGCGTMVVWDPPVFEDNCTFTVDNNYGPWSLMSPGVTTVWYTATDVSGNQATCSFDVTVRTLPGADAGLDVEICPEGSVQIGGAPTAFGGSGLSYMYVWTPADGLSATNVPNPVATRSDNMTYSVFVIDMISGCAAVDHVDVSVTVPTGGAALLTM